ncbi:uncharacterized protein LOC126846416 isoform X2 [Adelges cooleyi]|uniref:uncharacterized protein LOC126846416 isoform X2 n=1 Tax=Adelges cooleyi TaxID=133065 RepID=UPI00217FBF47|nr:uncharacterized protein LOC126846416 isoform X2 [Adelges cooleyi]
MYPDVLNMMSRKSVDEKNTFDHNIAVIEDTDTSAEDQINDDNIQYRFVYSNDEIEVHEMDTVQFQFVDGSSNIEYHSPEPSTSNVTNSGQKSGSRNQHGPLTEWKPEEVKLMLSNYKKYITDVGKDKTFKSKKEMWNNIAKNISDTFNVTRTPTQCMTKFKTLKKAKKLGSDVETTINATKLQNEMEAMDTIFNVVMEDVEAARINEIETRGQETNSSELEVLAHILPKTLIELAKVNARAQERRHREHMDFLRGFESRYMEMLDKKLK